MIIKRGYTQTALAGCLQIFKKLSVEDTPDWFCRVPRAELAGR